MEKVIEHFKKLVNINAPSFQEKPMADYLVQKLQELDFQVTVDNSGGSKGNTGNVIASRKGEGEYILLAAHMDTVEPTEGIVIKENDGKIFTDGSTILGADDRAGVVAILEALIEAKEEGKSTKSLEIVFTIAEEAGLNGSKGLDISKLKSKRAFVFDSGGDVGTVIVKAPAEIDFVAKIHGKAAHSGVNPEDGISAIKIIGNIIAQLPMGRIDEETTANIGIIQGGKNTNVVCPLVEVKGEVRSHSFDKVQNLYNQYKQTFEKITYDSGGTLEWSGETIYKNFEFTPEDEIVKFLKQRFDKLNIKMQLKPRGGGSDANIFNEKGIETVNLGVGMEKGHTKDEYITYDNLVNGVRLVKSLIVNEG